MVSILKSALKSAWNLPYRPTDRKKIKIKIHGLLEFASGPPLGGRPDVNSGRPWNLIHSPPCRTPCRLFIHELFFGPLGLHLLVWSELGRSPPFRPMRVLRLQWSWAAALVCEVALIVCMLFCEKVWREGLGQHKLCGLWDERSMERGGESKYLDLNLTLFSLCEVFGEPMKKL